MVNKFYKAKHTTSAVKLNWRLVQSPGWQHW